MRFRFAVGAPAFGFGGAFWLAPGAGGMPGPRTPFAGAAVLALATSRTANDSGASDCWARLTNSAPATVTASTVMAASTPLRIRFMASFSLCVDTIAVRKVAAAAGTGLERFWNAASTSTQVATKLFQESAYLRVCDEAGTLCDHLRLGPGRRRDRLPAG